MCDDNAKAYIDDTNWSVTWRWTIEIDHLFAVEGWSWLQTMMSKKHQDQIFNFNLSAEQTSERSEMSSESTKWTKFTALLLFYEETSKLVWMRWKKK